MATQKITQLTPGQERRLGEVYAEWLTVGRSCEPLNRAEVTGIVGEFYTRIGRPAPTVLFFSSPAMCVLAWGALSAAGAKREKLGDQLRGQLRDQLWGQLWGQLRDQLWGQLGGQLGDQLWGQLGDQLRGQLRDQLRDQLGGQLRGQLRDQLWGQLGGQLRDQLWGQLGGQLGDQLWGQLGDQLGGQLGGQLWDQLGGQLGDQLWGQLGDQLGDQLRGQLRDQLGDQLGGQLGGQLGNYFAGNQWCAWEVFYAFCGEIGVRYTPEQGALLDLWLRQSRGLHWWFPYEGLALCSERHAEIHVDDRGRLHSGTGMACRYSDGWGLYAWHGVNIPEGYYDLDAREILRERNAEVRRALIERYDEQCEKGQFIRDAGATLIDSAIQPMRPGEPDALNELLSIDLPDDPEGRMVYIKMIDPSTNRAYMIRVHPELRPLLGSQSDGSPLLGEPQPLTVRNALASTHGMRGEDYVLLQES